MMDDIVDHAPDQQALSAEAEAARRLYRLRRLSLRRMARPASRRAHAGGDRLPHGRHRCRAEVGFDPEIPADTLASSA